MPGGTVDGGWTDLGLPSPSADGLLFHTPRVQGRTDGGVLVAASEWQYDPIGKSQVGIAVPVFALGEGGWSVVDNDGAPGGFGLSEPIPGSPVGLQLAADGPMLVSTGSDGGVVLRVFPLSGGTRPAPVVGGVGAGTLLLLGDGTALVGAVLPVQHEPGPQRDGGQVQILHFTGTPGSAPRRPGGERWGRGVARSAAVAPVLRPGSAGEGTVCCAASAPGAG